MQAARQSSPALVLALFDIGARPDFAGLHTFVRAIEHANVPRGTVIYAGSYGSNQVTADAINGLPSGVYAPMFSITPKGSSGPYSGRNLPPEDLAKLDPRYDGPIPLRTPDKPLPRSDYLNWGRELGLRFRDTLRHRGAGGGQIATTWQFDEVVSETVLGGLTVPYRLYVAGILQGLHLGRSRLGDKPQTGMVWAAEKTLATLPQLPTPTGSPDGGALDRDRQGGAAVRRGGVRRVLRRPAQRRRALVARTAAHARRRARRENESDTSTSSG